MRHFIGKQSIYATRHQRTDVFQWQQSFSRIFWNEILPALEDLFDRIAGEKEYVYLDRLDIDLGTVSEQEILSGTWINRLIEQAELSLRKAKTESDRQERKPLAEQGPFGKWLYFLQHGNLPRFVSLPSENWQQVMLDTLGLHIGASNRLRSLMASHKVARQRLLLQHDTTFLVHIIELFTGIKQAELRLIWKELSQAWQHLSSQEISNQKESPQQPILARLTPMQIRLVQQLLPKGLSAQGKQDAAQGRKEIQQAWNQVQHDEWVKTADKEELERLLASLFLEAEHAGLQSDKRELQESLKSLSIQSIRDLEKLFWDKLLEDVFVRSIKSTPAGFMKMMFGEHVVFQTFHPVIKRLAASGKVQLSILRPILADVQEIQQARSRSAKTGPPRINPTQVDAKRSTDLIDIPNMEAPPKEGWYISAAGLVMLHPFLSHLFDKRGLMKEGVFVDEASRHKAAVLLHYLATGSEVPKEYELSLAKLLCGIPHNQPIDKEIALSEEDKAEAKELLLTVIEHWGALGNSSIEALREGFLIREGKLSAKPPDKWLLKIEPVGIDILLDQLPWGVHLIKLPWMTGILFVEWK